MFVSLTAAVFLATASVVDPVGSPITPAVVEPSVEAVVEAVVEPVAEPVAEPVVETPSSWRLAGLGSLTPAPGLRGIVEVVVAPHTILSVEGQTSLSVHRSDFVSSTLVLDAALLGGVRTIVTPDGPTQVSIGATVGVGFRYADVFATDYPELLTGRQGGLHLMPSVSAAAPIVVEHWLSPWMALRGQVNIASVAWSTDLVIDSDAPTGLDLALFNSPAVGVVFVL